MIEFIGWLGGILFAICGVPQAYKSYKDGHSNEISWLFLLLWLFGEILMLVYTLHKPVDLLPLIFNYGCNLLAICFILKYKIKPRK